MSDRFDQRAAFEVASFKALDGTKGQFEALVSVFGNVDLGGDRVVKGAFGKSLTQWREKGDPIPVIWNHMWENPDAHIGYASPDDVAETDDGLHVAKGVIDLDNPFGAQVYRLLKERRVREFSFGYNVRDSERKDGALELLDLDLFEFGPTLKGMNPETELLAVKALAAVTAPPPPAREVADETKAIDAVIGTKAGARHSKATRDLIRSHIDALTAHFLSDADTSDEPTKSVEAEARGKASDPDADLRTQIRLLEN